MQLNRVVITGMGAVSPFGTGVEPLEAGIANMQSAISTYEPSYDIGELKTHVAGRVTGIDSKKIPRKHRRTMTDMSIYAWLATQEALQQAAIDTELCTSGRLGIALASTTGANALVENFFANYIPNKTLDHCKSTTFFKLMAHSSVASIAQSIGITGRILSPSSACATSTQAIGLGYEAIALGQQDVMLCGGTDELHPLSLASFDFISAASTAYNDSPESTPRPFDRDRDGVVCAEGAGILVLESYDHAIARNATILGEMKGFCTRSSAKNPTSPDSEAIYTCMKETLKQANLTPADIGYINAHATGTVQGDIAEGKAIESLFGGNVPVSSFKGHIGHSLAASGALETIVTICGLQKGMLYSTKNLHNIEKDCGNIQLFTTPLQQSATYFLKNSFALGGITASIIIQRT